MELWQSADDGTVRLRASRCPRCGDISFPPRQHCRRCWAEGCVEFAVDPTGQLYSFTVAHVAPKGITSPYAVGLVDFPIGLRVFGQIRGADTAALACGQPVRVLVDTIRTGRDGAPVQGYCFTPVADGPATGGQGGER